MRLISIRAVWLAACVGPLGLLLSALTDAAERKQWITLTNCEYVAHSYNDGDSFRVRCGEELLVLRLYYVDAPEANLSYSERTREQAEYFGASLDDTLKAGERSKDYVGKVLSKPFTVITRKASAPGRSGDARYYALVQIGDKNLHEILVREGLARSKGMVVTLPTGEKPSVHVEKLLKLEKKAQKQRKGIWKDSTKVKNK